MRTMRAIFPIISVLTFIFGWLGTPAAFRANQRQ